MLKTFTLKNGLKVATYSIPQMKSVFISEAVKGGSIFDTPKTSGLAHYMEHILVEGTPSFPNVQVLSDYIESLAGSYNASTGSQIVKFYINGPANHLSDLVKIASEVFFEPLFPDESIERERGAILQEINQRIDSDWYKKARFFADTRYKKGHPLLLDGGGSKESVLKLQKKDLIEHWSKFFYPQNAYLTIVGGFSHLKIEELLEQYYGVHESGKKFSGFPKFTNRDMSDRTIAIRYDQDLNTCYIDLTFPTITNDDPIKDQMQQSIAGNILGRLRGSRLYRLLRQQRGLVYGVDMGSSTMQHFAYAYVSTQTAPNNVEEVVDLIAKELALFIKNGPTNAELEFAKNYSVNQVLMQFDHPANIAGWIEDDLLWSDKIYLPEEYAKIIGDINREDVMDFMKKYWDFKKLNLTVQGPIKNTNQNIKKLEKILEVL